jgi:hypothetical protein
MKNVSKHSSKEYTHNRLQERGKGTHRIIRNVFVFFLEYPPVNDTVEYFRSEVSHNRTYLSH